MGALEQSFDNTTLLFGQSCELHAIVAKLVHNGVNNILKKHLMVAYYQNVFSFKSYFDFGPIAKKRGQISPLS